MSGEPKGWIAQFNSPGELDRLVSSLVKMQELDMIFVHPEYFAELCAKLGVKPEDILSKAPSEEEE